MTTVVPSLQPVSFTARQALRTPSGTRQVIGSTDSGSTSALVANPKLSIIEVENLLRENVQSKYINLQQGFQNYDVNQSLSITKVEFRRVLEAFCFPFTTEQFDAIMNKVDTNPNSTVRYCDFLEKFSMGRKVEAPKVGLSTERQPPAMFKLTRTQSPKENNIDMIEKMIKDKIQKNVKTVIKALRLCDYNRDGHVPRHELRKVLENHCFKLTDQQFDKLYQRYDFHHRGVVNYKDFLYRLGVSVSQQNLPSDSAEGAGSRQQQPQPSDHQAGPVVLRPEDIAAGMNIYQLEVEFRKKMRENYVDLKRMFLSFDRHLDGFISIEDLKAILNNFTIPMSDQLFAQLMDRFGIKASGKISWEFFLEKFQDAQGPGNGQTIPIKPAHKFFPIRGSEEKLELKDVIRLLHDHVTHAYSSFKNAFLQIDKNRDGKISRKELKKVIENFKFRLTDEQFKELMIVLDPHQTNCISYHKFLGLFEERETKEGHKWLTSVHRYNDTQKPAIMAWETVEGILREKIAEFWKSISAAVVRSDQQATGKIPPKVLRKILEQYVLPISDEHFENLINRIKDRDDKGRVNYIEFFTSLGVSVKPGDLDGLSTQITDSNKQEVDRLHDDQCARQGNILQHAAERTDMMSVEEIIVRIKDHISQHSTQLRNAFLKYDRKRRGKISKRVLREILESFGFLLSDEQYQALCSQLQFQNGFMTYTDFIQSFQDPRIGGPAQDLQKINNHKVNKIRGDEWGMTAQQAEMKLMSKLRENFEGLRGAFYKFDDDHNGIVTKGNFRCMLDSFMIPMTDEEFDKFCKILGIDKKSRISYRDFLDAFEMRDTKEGHKWLDSCHRYNEVKPMQLLDAARVHEILCEKAHRQWKDLAKAFRTMDSSGNGVITRRELRETLYRFMLPMSKAEFDKLWTLYDSGKKGAISHQDFLRHLTADKFAPGDQQGTSNTIAFNSQIRLEEQHLEQQAKQEQITINQANTITAFSVDHVLKQLKDKIRDVYKDPYTAFCKYDRRHKGHLNVNDIQKVLVDFNFLLDDDQYYDFLQKIKMVDKNSKMTYNEFLAVFEEGRADNYEPAPKDHPYPQVLNEKMKADSAEEKMKRKIAANTEVLQKAFQAFDKQSTGRIHTTDLRRLLDNFCFKMTNDQYKSFESSLSVNAEGMVDYQSMMDNIKGPHSDTFNPQKWISSTDRQLQGDFNMQPLTMEEVTQHLKEVVTSKFLQMAKAFTDADYATIGVVSKEDFQDVLYKFTVRLTKDQFEKLWESLNVNEFGNIDYGEFLKSFTLNGGNQANGLRPLTADSIRPYTAMSELGRKDLRSSQSLQGNGPERPFTPLVNAEDVENKVREKVKGHWKEIQKQCRSIDRENTGEVSQNNFKMILRQCNISLSEDQLRKLLLKYDINNNDCFCYNDFLRHFMLSSNIEGNITSSRSSRGHKQARKPGQGDGNSAMERLKRCVLDHWKEMRKEFRTIDRNAIGVVSPNEFRQVLRQFNINMTEEEFFDVMKHYDKDMSGMISYNDFVRTFLQTH